MCPICNAPGSPSGPAAMSVRRPKKPKKKSDESSEEEDEQIPANFGVMKPDITFFGEALPSRFEELLLGGDADKCDLLVCIGTSLKVAPVSEIIRIVDPQVPQVYISKTPVYHNEFDITFLGSCDDVVEHIASKMSWTIENDKVKGPFSGKIEFDEDDSIYRFLAASESPSPSESTINSASSTVKSNLQQDKSLQLPDISDHEKEPSLNHSLKEQKILEQHTPEQLPNQSVPNPPIYNPLLDPTLKLSTTVQQVHNI